jgi:hypothetical protein
MPFDEKRVPFASDADTFFGLERTVSSHEALLSHMMQAVEDLAENGFSRSLAKKRVGGQGVNLALDYHGIFLADTFFSDTLLPKDLFKIFRAVKSHGVPCQTLFLNPFSDQARVRAMMLAAEDARKSQDDKRQLTTAQQKALNVSTEWQEIQKNRKRREAELNTVLSITLRRSLAGLENLNAALTAIAKPGTELGPTRDLPTAERDVRQQLATLLMHLQKLRERRGARDLDVEIRFTSDLLLSPVYILGPYVYRGVLMPRSAAISKPWSIYRDDPARSDDMFELAKEGFEQTWNAAISLGDLAAILQEHTHEAEAPGALRSLMVAYSEDNKGALEQIAKLLDDERVGFTVQSFPKAAATGDVPRDTVSRMLDASSAGIALLLHDEEIKSLRRRRDEADCHVTTRRSRPNVIHEMGLMQGKYGFDRVLLVMEDGLPGYDKPANIDGMREARVKVDPQTRRMDEAQLRGILLSFLNELGGR